MSYGYSSQSRAASWKGATGIAISHRMCSSRKTYTLDTVSPVSIAILDQNSHQKHRSVPNFHFGIQLPFYSLISPYLENRDSVELAACGSWGGFTRIEHLHWRIQEGPTFQYQVGSPWVILSGSCIPLSLSKAYSALFMAAHPAVTPSSGREGEGFGVLVTPLTVFTAQGRPSQHLVIQGLAEATGVSSNRTAAQRSCFFST